MKSLREANINPNYRVFVRCDLDVPLKNGEIEETYRLDSSLDTLKYIIEKGATPVIAGHLGRPEGQYSDELSTRNLTPYYDAHLGSTHYVLLENLRFDPREENNDAAFAQELAQKADIYVDESFATCHREHASIVGVPQYLDSYAGLCLEKEINRLSRILDAPEKPLVAIVGGAKVESKLPVIAKFLEIADHILIGGKLVIDGAVQIPESDKISLAFDYTEGNFDIGPESITQFKQRISTAKTIIWAGPLGFYEKDYIHGTKEIAEAVIASRAYSVIGGGDTIAALRKVGLLDKFNFVSTGGSAMLEFISKGTLPGLEALN